MKYSSSKIQIGRFIWLTGLGIVFVIGRESFTFFNNIQKLKSYMEQIQHPLVIYINDVFTNIANATPEALNGLIDTFDSLFFPESGTLCADIDWVTEACLPFE